ncbi:MAG: hypothetical protein LUH10_00125 [Tannerellaceae bacterium]|nr:hypothetical protein [Tannerellaceae bacterium]
MAKNIGILLDPATGDLQVSTLKDETGRIAEGLEIGYITYQNQALILQAIKGEIKEYPTLGVAINEMIADHETVGWKREILLQLEADGMSVRDVEIDFENKNLSIDAEYN